MRLTSFDLYRYKLPLSGPVTLKKSLLLYREGLLMRLTAQDGSVGWGEAAPLPGFSHETLEDATEQLREVASSLTGQNVPGDWTNHADLAPSARFGLELAAWNQYANSSGKLLPEPINNTRESVTLNGLLSGASERLIEEAERMRVAGYRAVKLKVGGRGLVEDVRLVRKVGEALGVGVSLRLDANRAWSFEEALEFGRRLAGAPVEYVEEPLAEPGRLGELAGLWGLAVALDESLVGMEPEKLTRHRYAGAVVLKPTLLDGISQTLRFAEEAKALGMKAVISSSYESGVATGGLVALAAAVGDGPVGLDTYRRLAEDVIEFPLDLPAPTVDVRRALEASRRVDVRKIAPVSG